jgi:predicted phage terminase large subunit-like protein
MLAQDPSLKIAIVSYSATKAERWGRWLRRMIEAYGERFNLHLRSDSRAVDRFETTAGGQVVCVGVGGGLTGEQVDLMIIDDPVRGRAEAESPTYRESAWDWWESVGATRLSSRGKVVLMMTRWHADDLAGRILNREPRRWKELRIPAVRDLNAAAVRDPGGAEVYTLDGELISAQNRRPGYYKELEHTRSPYVWRSIYMQTPVVAEGNLFRRDDVRYWYPLASDPSHHDALGGRRISIDGVSCHVGEMTRFITVDLAASTKTSADWTVASCWAISLDGHLILLDRRKARIGEADHWDLVRPMVLVWACPQVYVEKGFIGTTLVRDATRSGVRIEGVDADTDKVTRALPATQRLKAHMVLFPAGADWLDDALDELAEFPSGAHDDFVDTFSYAARIISAHWNPPATGAEAEALARREDTRVKDRALSAAYESATGLRAVVDLNTAEW